MRPFPLITDDTALAAFPAATPFHTAAWSAALAEAYGLGLLPVVVGPRTEDGGPRTGDSGQPRPPSRLPSSAPRPPDAPAPPSPVLRPPSSGQHAPRALLPLAEIRSPLTGRRGVALPFTDDCPPLADSPDAAREVILAALALGRERRWRTLEIRGGAEFLPDVPPSTTFLRHRLDLRAPADVLLQRTDSAVRRAIRKAESSGLTLETSTSLDALRTFVALLEVTRRKHGVPPQPFAFFLALHRHLLEPGHGRIILARHSGEPVAGALYLHHGSTVIYKYGASDEAKQHLRGNNLVMWHAIRTYAAEGYATFDFGRTSHDNAGLRAFKQSWGTTEDTLKYLKYDYRSDRWTTAPDRSTSWHTPIFRRLPLALSRPLGALLYRHIG